MSSSSPPTPRSSDPKIASLQSKVDESRKLMTQNVKMTLDRGIKLEAMEVQTEELSTYSLQFRNGARRVRRMMCVRSCKMTALIAVVIVVLLLVIVVPIVVQLRK